MEQEEIHRIHRNFRVASIAAVLVLSIGTVFYHFVEKLSFVDAFYFSAITLTTVGYGDISPHTTFGKLFTVFYIFGGIAIIATFGNLLIKRAVINRQQKNRQDTR